MIGLELRLEQLQTFHMDEEGISEGEVYSDEELISYLSDLSNRLGKSPSFQDVQQATDLPGPMVFIKKFGSWNNALKAANLPVNSSPQYSKGNLIQILQIFYKQYDNAPTVRQRDKELPSEGTFIRYFGSWKNALIEAKLPQPKIRRYSKDELLSYLKILAKQLGRAPTSIDMEKAKHFPTSKTYYYHFKSWYDALGKAGLSNDGRNEYKYSKEKLIEILRDHHTQNNRIPRKRDMGNGKPCYATFEENFGSWNNALKEAGFSVRKRQFCNDDELIQILRKLRKDLRRLPKPQDVERIETYPRSGVFVMRFGSWENALRKAKLLRPRSNRKGKYSDEELIAFLHKYRDTYGKNPTGKLITQAVGFPTAHYFMYAFGSWNDALHAARLKHNMIPRRKKLILDLKSLAHRLKRVPSKRDLNSTPGFPRLGIIEEFGSWPNALNAAELKKKKNQNESLHG